jgi:antitoxin MazE
MQSYVKKWGNSLGVRLPATYVKDFSFTDGSSVEITEEDGGILIRPRKITLEGLLSEVNDKNTHSTVDTGPSLGAEEW